MPKCDCVIPAYNDRVNVYDDSSTDDNPAPDYSVISIASMPCKIMTVNGDEMYRGRQLEARLSHVVETPYRSGLKAEMRLAVVGGIYDGQLLNVQSVRPIRKAGHPPYIELYCRELET